MNMLKKISALSYCCLLILISGCDIFEDAGKKFVTAAFDCTFGSIVEIGPVSITTVNLPSGSLGVSYSTHITSEILLEPDDDKYIYEYTFTPDQLPDGLSYRADGRRLFIEGVPQLTGDFRLTVEVYSPTLKDHFSDIPSVCERAHSDSKIYYILIE